MWRTKLYTNNIKIIENTNHTFCQLEKTKLQPQAHKYLVLNPKMWECQCCVIHMLLAFFVFLNTKQTKKTRKKIYKQVETLDKTSNLVFFVCVFILFPSFYIHTEDIKIRMQYICTYVVNWSVKVCKNCHHN